MVSIVYCLGTVIFHVVLSEFGDEHVNEGCLTWEREGIFHTNSVLCITAASQKEEHKAWRPSKI